MILGELLERVYRATHTNLVNGIATGGTATTIVDSGLITKPFTENKFKDYIVFITRTTDGLTPQGKYGIATAYVKSTGTITIPTVTDAVQVGDRYSLCKPDVPLYTMEDLCNDGLRYLGGVDAWDTSLITAAATLRYTLPIAAKGLRLRSLYLRNPSNTFITCEAPNYDVENSVGGSQPTLVFKSQPLSNMTIVFNYIGDHPTLTAYNSYVNEKIYDQLAIAACIEQYYGWRVVQKQKPLDQKNWNFAKAKLEEAKRAYPIETPTVENKRVPIGLFNGNARRRDYNPDPLGRYP